MGLGIIGARRMMDGFDIRTSAGAGTTVVLRKRLPRRGHTPSRDAARIADTLAQTPRSSIADEVQQQNHELLAALDELRQRQEDLSRLGAELQDTNRGVVALYAELDEKAEHLRRADEMKSKFLSNMTHEFQTPLNSILALTRLLLDRADGDLTSEQEKQVRFIRQASQDLSELVTDLLDIAKVEAGRVTVRPASFIVSDLFGALRGLMRPLQTNDAVILTFDTPDSRAPLFTDEAKVSQVLRNYISNALKFTERGEVRVTAQVHGDGTITFSVADTGIGIAAKDQGRLFHEFGQVPNPLQTKVRGTGLGLSLSKRLAELLGGTVGVESAPGVGSTFTLRIPMTAPGFETAATDLVPAPAPAPGRREAPLVLVIDDEQAARYLLRKLLTSLGCTVIEAGSGETGLQRAAEERPVVIVLDLQMPDMLGTEVLARLKRAPATAAIPVIIATSQIIPTAERERLETHAAAVIGKSRLGEADGVEQIRGVLQAAGVWGSE
jgi:signal transduction histidine kinase/CheY-like chemotaxis protein